MTKPKPERGRSSARRKADAVLRLLRGEALDPVSRELRVTPGTLSGWRKTFLSAGQAGLKSRQPAPGPKKRRGPKTACTDEPSVAPAPLPGWGRTASPGAA